MNESVLYEINLLKDFCNNVLLKVEVESENSEMITDSLICADLRGVKSHGIVRLPTYVERIEKGILDPKASMKFEKNAGAISLLNANNGFGQVAGYKAMKAAIDIARVYGIGMVGVKNSNHFGIASYYSMLALEEDMIGLVITHSSPAIAPYGTTKPLLGTNPLSIAVPADKQKPIVLDMSMSMVARGKIRYAALTGSKIPIGWGLDEDGNPTEDPNEALKGSLVPIGGVKGSALSLIIDILCGILTDSCLTGEVKTVTDMSGPARTGHMFCAINISSFIEADKFKQNVDSVISKIKAFPAVSDNIYMAGEIEYNLAKKRIAEGLPVEQDVINTLNALAQRYGVSKL
ncbi:MAG TPA: Ldh family oxidoreductase [Thermoanaerobacterales bacterium]|jgi:LDH2 family malate/lactate/ureidoglycolate dehydrogenase|nr:Ldh family oxidoreductase [Thermoanaerobacterales bacterium]